MADFNGLSQDIQGIIGGYLTGQRKEELAAMFPDDFEVYAMQLQLLDSRNALIDSLVFPVMPDSLEVTQTYPTQIQKSASGIIVTANSSFNPFTISMQGTFGRMFKTLIGRRPQPLDFVGISIREFNAQIKTGFGALKVLENMLEFGNKYDGYGLPYRLVLFNLAFNQVHMVECTNFSCSQSQQSNMVWHYNLSLTAVAPATNLLQTTQLDIRKLIHVSNIQNSAQKLADTAFNLLNYDVPMGVINTIARINP